MDSKTAVILKFVAVMLLREIDTLGKTLAPFKLLPRQALDESFDALFSNTPFPEGNDLVCLQGLLTLHSYLVEAVATLTLADENDS